MLTDYQHAELKHLLKKATEGSGWDEKRYALEDACKLVGVTLDRGFVSVETMKAGRNPHRCTDAELDAAIPHPDSGAGSSTDHFPGQREGREKRRERLNNSAAG